MMLCLFRSRGALTADTSNAWIADGGVANERKKGRSARILGGFAGVDGDNLARDERREIFSN